MRLIFLSALFACSTSAKRDDAPPTVPTPAIPPSEPSPHVPGAKVYLSTPHGEIGVDVEVVATEAKIQRGLMYRQHLGLDEGMLFELGADKDWTFWMHNTLIPLDMIFIRRDLTIAGIVQSAEPQTDTIRKVGEPSLYVLEVNGGWTAAHSVVKDAKVRFDLR